LPHVCGFTVFGVFRRCLFNGSRAYARCRDVWHIPRHGMGHAEQRRPLPRSCKRYSRMHVVARWPHRELHRAAEKFKLRHHPIISTTMSQNPNGAVIRGCLRECGRFATWHGPGPRKHRSRAILPSPLGLAIHCLTAERAKCASTPARGFSSACSRDDAEGVVVQKMRDGDWAAGCLPRPIAWAWRALARMARCGFFRSHHAKLRQNAGPRHGAQQGRRVSNHSPKSGEQLRVFCPPKKREPR
jgi:hypothetical protein